MELYLFVAAVLVALALAVAFGAFDRAESPTEHLTRCERCGKPTMAPEYHRPRCRGRLGERTFSAHTRRD